ncbi:proteasome subunit alpha [Amycolatopsis sp. CA-230715]|uniref:proteasome subunit alpha n=1 Tax=Amycolatopsis sp. CA-230715 TaxID=2745196 RepID=UPI001C031AFA|nr:proteasome subunit alpha [Amycolatopsis sp. CA-230715]QWF85445.1 Proteasome subunit alpha 2 [Amycolatopsis sp. CA-230715]
MTMPLYASPEQVLRERSELARKGIARGRSVVVLKYANGVLFVAENPSTTLHKLSEIYDRIGFAAVGRYSEFENLRVAGIRHADLKGLQFDRRDVSARALANAYAATLGSIFTEQLKPFEVEVCVAEIGASSEEDQLFRLTYDGSIGDEPRFVVMGGHADTITTKLKESYEPGLELADAVKIAVEALRSPTAATGSGSAANGNGDSEPVKLEVAVLDRNRPRRAFKRIEGAALEAVLPAPDKGDGDATKDDAGSEDEKKDGDSEKE